MTESVVVTEEHGKVALVRLNRPRVLGALNAALLAELDQIIAELTLRSAVRAIVLTGTGEKAFSAGADLDELAGLGAAAAYDALARGQAIFRRIETCPIPVITAVNGLALGGGFELVLATSFPVMAEHATFGLPESSLGLIPGYGGTQRLTRAIGRRAAVHAMLTASRITAARAYQIGLTPVEPVPGPDLLDTTLALAAKVAQMGPRAVRSILAATAVSADQSLEAGLSTETGLAAVATGSSDAAEGIAAFRGKRAANFADFGDRS
ncbi:enoyl-CoA hydratase/isomerase family protein [Mycolicibacterium sp. XJ1819]